LRIPKTPKTTPSEEPADDPGDEAGEEPEAEIPDRPSTDDDREG
jgi:hypothetical protein